MATSYQNNSQHIYALLAIALLWIFWPIISPTLLVLNYIAFLPLNIALTFVFTFGESILFIISLGCFGLFTKDIFSKKRQEATTEEPLEKGEGMAVEERIMGEFEENVSATCVEEPSAVEMLLTPSEEKIHLETVGAIHEEAKINFEEEASPVEDDPGQVEAIDDGEFQNTSSNKLEDVNLVQDTLNDLVHDIIVDDKMMTEAGLDMSPSAC